MSMMWNNIHHLTWSEKSRERTVQTPNVVNIHICLLTFIEKAWKKYTKMLHCVFPGGFLLASFSIPTVRYITFVIFKNKSVEYLFIPLY